jgi:hypothetical protein
MVLLLSRLAVPSQVMSRTNGFHHASSGHPLSPSAATTSLAKRREPWLKFIAAVAPDFTESELGLMSWATVRGLLDYVGIVDPMEVALVQLEWREHCRAVEARRARIAAQDKAAAEERAREEEARRREDAERAANEAAAAEAKLRADEDAALRKKLGLHGGSSPALARNGSPPRRVVRTSTTPLSGRVPGRSGSADAAKAKTGKPAAAATSSPAVAKRVTYAGDGASPQVAGVTVPPSAGGTGARPAIGKPTTPGRSIPELSPTTKTREAESKAAAIMGGRVPPQPGDKGNMASPAVARPATGSTDRAASSLSPDRARAKVELDLFVLTPGTKGSPRTDDRAASAEPAEPQEAPTLDDCRQPFQEWCRYANGTTDKAINFGRFMRWLKHCDMLDRHFTPREAEAVFRHALQLAASSPGAAAATTSTDGRGASVASAMSYGTAAGDGERMSYAAFRMKLLPEMAAKLRCTTLDLVRRFQFCGGPRESSPKKRVDVFHA